MNRKLRLIENVEILIWHGFQFGTLAPDIENANSRLLAFSYFVKADRQVNLNCQNINFKYTWNEGSTIPSFKNFIAQMIFSDF